MSGRLIPPQGGISDVVHTLIGRHQADPTHLLQILCEIQEIYTHIPREAIRAIATGLWIPFAEVQGVIDFYSFLHGTPGARYDLLFSDCIVDEFQGSEALAQVLCRRLDVELGKTRADGLVRVGHTSCTGLCDQGPALLVNGQPIPRLDRARVETIGELIEQRVALAAWPTGLFQVEEGLRRADRLLGTDWESGAALRAVGRRGSAIILEEIKRSGLRGLGGAGFAAGAKWQACRAAPAKERFVVCNADEGEPGTFKDRLLLQRYADLVFEGMTLCGRLIGARQGFLYLRGEYRYLLEHLKAVLERRRRAGLLGSPILGQADFAFEIAIHIGAGAYVCGEESALIESLEGKRGVPRKRPPFPVTHGYRQQPTVVNNVETFAQSAAIAVHGVAWFRRCGTAQSPGTKLLSVSGDCAHPGIYEYPFGIAVAEVLAECGARTPQAVQIAGAAGHCIPEAEFHRRIAFEDLATGGALMVFGQTRDLVAVVRRFARFFAHESCGFCTPCRVGTSLLRDLIEKMYRGHGSAIDLAEMRNLAALMQRTSHCGLGQSAANSVVDTLDKFPDVWKDRLAVASFEPAFDLDGALETARHLTGRDDREAHL